MRAQPALTLVVLLTAAVAGCLGDANTGASESTQNGPASASGADGSQTYARPHASPSPPPPSTPTPSPTPSPSPSPTADADPEPDPGPRLLGPAPRVDVAFTIRGPSVDPDPDAPSAWLLDVDPGEVVLPLPVLLVGNVTNALPSLVPAPTFVIPDLGVTVGPIAAGDSLVFEVRIDEAGEYAFHLEGPEEHPIYALVGAEGVLIASEDEDSSPA